MKKAFLLLFCLLTVQSFVFAQQKDLLSTDDVSRVSDDVVKALEVGNTEQALEIITANLLNKEKNAKELVSFMKSTGEKYGDLEGTGFAKKEVVGDFLVRCTYALKYKECPVWVQFLYYKADEKFGLKKVEWGEDIEKLF